MMTYLQLGRMGRMANAMFEIAGTIGIAVKCNQSYAFPKWINHDAKDRFGSTEDIDLYKYFINPLPEVPYGLPFQDYPYFWGYREIWHDQQYHQGNWNMNAHFQSPKYFYHCIDLIRHYFTMENEEDYDACAVHYRAGDYDNSYHPVQPLEYYLEAIKRMPEGTHFKFFSDDIDQFEEKIINNLPFINHSIVRENYIDSFRIMKRCKHFICANSSYSMMAAILANQKDKIVVAPKKWFGSHVNLETSDIYPFNCIVI